MKGGDNMRRSFMEWFLALLRSDMEAYPTDSCVKARLLKKITSKIAKD